VIPVIVDGPMGKDDVGVLGGEELGELLIMGCVDHGLAVDLAREEWMRAQDLTRLLGFRGPDGRAIKVRCFLSLAEAFATIKVEQGDVMTKSHVAGDGAGAAAFGVARVGTGDENLQTSGG
jgi:hypothetical protein